jgi:hypothetical protein
MGRKISLSIDLGRINKDWFVLGKGTPPKKYLAIDVYENDQVDAYGNQWSAKQTPPKDVRADMKQRGEKIPYCGNGKEWADRQAPAPAPKSSPKSTPPPQENIDEDVPF